MRTAYPPNRGDKFWNYDSMMLTMVDIGKISLHIKLTPIMILSALALVGLIATAVFIMIPIQQPWLGLVLAPEDVKGVRVIDSQGPSNDIPIGTVLVNIKNGVEEMDLLPIDLTIEPDGTLHTYDIYDNFLSRQGCLSTLLRRDVVIFTDIDNTEYIVRLQENRPITDLPVTFWVQIIVGLFAWVISSAVFAFRTNKTSARFLLLSGAATLTFAPFFAIYSTRELAIPERLFAFLSDGNFLGGSIFTASFVALLLCYPKRIAPKWTGPAILALFIIWFILQQVDVFSSMTFARRFLVMIGVFSTFILAGIHWFTTKREPVARAALQWFLLSWMLGTSLFWFFILMPQMFGIDTTPIQGYGFSLFLLVYAGLALGILRYKLFALGAWWGKIVLWALTVLILVLLDLLFLFALQLSSSMSISLALLLSGLVWLPLRSFVWNRYLSHRTIEKEEQFKQVIDIALTPSGQDILDRWKHLLRNLYNPLYLHECKNEPECAIDQDGQVLVIKSVGTIPALRLEFASNGKKLFTTSDVNLANELVTLLEHIIDNRSEYAKGVSEERKRIALDMHDNIGAQLLGALHNQNVERKDTLIRETLSDLRDIINDTSRVGHSFDEMLAGLRAETTERLSIAGVTLSWSVKDEGTPHISPKTIHALRSIVREAVSNVIKHATASNAAIEIQCLNGEIKVSIEDNGKGYENTNNTLGHGLSNMKSRIIGLNGDLLLTNKGSGLHLQATFPVYTFSEGT